jgi:hypothetical protein
MRKKKAGAFTKIFEILDAYNKEVQENGEKILKEAFKEFFDKHPEVESLRWNQYTPGFNDGDPCTFTVGELMFRTYDMKKIADGEADKPEETYYEDDDDCYDCSYGNEYDPVLKQDIRNLSENLSDAEDILLKVFDDNMQITVTRENITAEEYDCGY